MTPETERSRGSGHAARLVVAAFLAGYFLLLGALGGHSGWGRLGVPAIEPHFVDMRSVTSGWECARRGVEVLEVNPCDPYMRPANYPQVWMSVSFLGLGQGSTTVLAVCAALLFLGAAIAVVPPRAPPGDAAVYGAALCSPAVMLGIERGNVDIALFALLVLAVLLLRRSRTGAAVAHALVLAAAILKLFPIFAIGVLARQQRRAALIGVGVVAAAFAVYALATLDDIRTIGRVVPQTDWYSYGIRTFGIWWSNAVPPFSARVWDTLLAAAVLVALLAVRGRLERRLPVEEPDPEAVRDLDLFWAGAGIYVCTFTFFQSFDYRLVFLVLTLPQLLRWTHARRWIGVVAIVLVLATLWLASPWTGVPVIGWLLARWEDLTAFRPFFDYRSLTAAATTQLLLAVSLLAGLVATLPIRWLRADGARAT